MNSRHILINPLGCFLSYLDVIEVIDPGVKDKIVSTYGRTSNVCTQPKVALGKIDAGFFIFLMNCAPCVPPVIKSSHKQIRTVAE